MQYSCFCYFLLLLSHHNKQKESFMYNSLYNLNNLYLVVLRR